MPRLMLSVRGSNVDLLLVVISSITAMRERGTN
jgi:hypothetical protein